MKRHLRPWYSWVRKRVRDSTCVLPSLHPSLILVFHHPHCVWKTQSSQAARVSCLGDLGVIPLPSLCSPCGHFLHALFSRPLALMKRWPLAFSDRAGISRNLLSSLDGHCFRKQLQWVTRGRGRKGQGERGGMYGPGSVWRRAEGWGIDKCQGETHVMKNGHEV